MHALTWGGSQGDGNEGVFTERDELLQTEACSGNAQLAELMQGSFACLCDVKESGGVVYYRLNNAKVPLLLLACIRNCQLILHLSNATHQCCSHRPSMLIAVPNWEGPAGNSKVMYCQSVLGLGIPKEGQPLDSTIAGMQIIALWIDAALREIACSGAGLAALQIEAAARGATGQQRQFCCDG